MISHSQLALQRVAVECSFASAMNLKEHRSLLNQILRCYGHNKKSRSPLDLHLTGLGVTPPECLPPPDHLSTWEEDGRIKLLQPSADVVWRPGELIWLSPDATKTLEAPLSQYRNKVIIIGGLIDKSVKKGLTLQRAADHGAEAYRLPVREHAPRSDLHPIMTVTGVIQVLCALEGGATWTESFESVFPNRAIKRRERESEARAEVLAARRSPPILSLSMPPASAPPLRVPEQIPDTGTSRWRRRVRG